jgi:hypothetical protein
MTLQEFNSLNQAKQQSEILNSGVFLMERTEPSIKIWLYHLHGFYVEVFYINYLHKVCGFKGFDTTEELEPYLQQIKISGLMEEVFSPFCRN